MSNSWFVLARRPGGPEVMEPVRVQSPMPRHDEARVRLTAIGVNIIDTLSRSGVYPFRDAPNVASDSFPRRLGIEGSGIIEAIGSGVTGLSVGERVGIVTRTPGTYATHVVTKADALFPLPTTLDNASAAAVLLKGLTTWMLVERCAKVEAGQVVLVQAAAGGTGSLLVQWLKAVGATVIAHTSSEQKAQAARESGADESLTCALEDLPAAIRLLTNGKGVAAAFDGVGADTWTASIQSIARRGIMVSFGNASGPVQPFSPIDLLHAGSLFLTRPTIYDYIDSAESRGKAAKRLFDLIAQGFVKAEIGQIYNLSDVATAHRKLENRSTLGSTVLIP